MPFNNMFYGQPTNPPLLVGKVISDLKDIRPQEVPFDGAPAVYPSSDLRYVIVKIWDSNCELQTFKFVREDIIPVQNQAIDIPTQQTIIEPVKSDPISEKLDMLINRMNNLEQKVASQQPIYVEAKPASSAQNYYGNNQTVDLKKEE